MYIADPFPNLQDDLYIMLVMVAKAYYRLLLTAGKRSSILHVNFSTDTFHQI
jgi:hypothetical protein